jgi:2',3'-cyclic-nucleotide 2'-phosphodiesterase (5'-nucleotidase family)
MLVDGGDFFNSYPFPALDEAMLRVLQKMSYNVIMPGDQAFIEGEGFYRKLISAGGSSLLISNDASAKNKSIQTHIGPYQIETTALFSAAAFQFIKQPAFLKLLPIADFSISRQDKNSLRIVVIHGTLAEARQFAEKNSDINIIFLAHEQEKGLWDQNGVMIVANGKDSEYISSVKIKHDSAWQAQVEYVKISEALPEAEDILDIIDQFKKNSDN